MLARATRAFQEHMKDMTDKNKNGCACSCVGKPATHTGKENVIINAHTDTAHYVVDNTTNTKYVRGKLLGKGGFAKCYELTDMKTGKTYAGKIISKTRLTKPHQREKIAREIELHRPLKQRHVVGFHSYFEDEENVYIILENCSRKSLVHVLKNRKVLTEPEVRYYMKHLVEGCKYIHNQKIIHRDLKLGNMLLNDKMEVKIGDFGLATRVEYDGEKKLTVCGTPNYIAPEVLQKKGHSYEADIWAMGCVMYALLVGRPPFETTTLKETYVRITSNKYFIPPHLSTPARNLISKLLNPNPSQRPSLDKILADEFFSGYTPKVLSSACCDTVPKFPVSNLMSRPKSYAAAVTPQEAMMKITSSLAQLKGRKTSSSENEEKTTKDNVDGAIQPKRPNSTEMKGLPLGSAVRLYQMLSTCLGQMPEDSKPSPVLDVQPLLVTKWVDYSNKYGFGFQMSDKSVGVLFNDNTRMTLGADARSIQYIERNLQSHDFNTEAVPNEFERKATLLLYFAQYMDEHLIHGGDVDSKSLDKKVPVISMRKWFRTQKAIIMYLSNGTFQVNFFEDHTKVILSPDGQDYLVTYINTDRQATTYRLLQLRHFGCIQEIAERLSYAKDMLQHILETEGEAV